MSTQHSKDYHLGHGDGYAEGESDVIAWVEETLAEWRSLGIYSHAELWAAKELETELRLRRERCASNQGAD